MPKNNKKILVASSLLASSVLFALILCELFLRLIGALNNIDFTLYMKELKNSDRLPAELYMHHGNLHKLRPGVQVLAITSDFSVIYKVNSQGLRDKEYDFAKPKNKTRILAFGDSYTFGEGVAYGERFTDIIENSFANLEVINFGVPGYGLDQMLIQFMAEGLKYSLDYVIIFINKPIIDRYPADIMKNNYVDPAIIIAKSPVNNPSTAYINRNDTFFNKRKHFLALYRSFLFSFLNYRLRLFTLKNKLRKDDKRTWDAITAECKKEINITKGSTSDTNIDPIATRTIPLINKFNDICKQYGVKLILININDYFSNMDFLKNLDNNIAYYDLTGALINESKKYNLCFVYDRHYNKKTHSFIGRKTVEILRAVMR